MEIVLEVKNLTKTFKQSKKQMKISKNNKPIIKAVDDLSFVVKKGTITSLLGANGAGKTTTLRMISTLIKPDSGDIIVDNVSLKDDCDTVRRKIGFLTSELKLEDFFTPNYLFDYFSKLHGVEEEVYQKRKEVLFKKFGIDKFSEVKIADLSTGMKQKVSLVISVVHDPMIIIFDEPTNGLDVITAKSVTDFLIELKKEGKTILLSTHIFSLVEKLSDDVIIIDKGKKVLEGSLSDVTSEKDLESVFFELHEMEEN